ncbi:jg2396 [Pararge aegeria aegeria]|uniref:Jg2396 protein n=1 Tax=Pararge aegeria aegeria TaxID=348720 RepID=A0A8S4S182_9NEOP|nr:jg2396 [Pararge aegeria aegeria]
MANKSRISFLTCAHKAVIALCFIFGGQSSKPSTSGVHQNTHGVDTKCPRIIRYNFLGLKLGFLGARSPLCPGVGNNKPIIILFNAIQPFCPKVLTLIGNFQIPAAHAWLSPIPSAKTAARRVTVTHRGYNDAHRRRDKNWSGLQRNAPKWEIRGKTNRRNASGLIHGVTPDQMAGENNNGGTRLIGKPN